MKRPLLIAGFALVVLALGAGIASAEHDDPDPHDPIKIVGDEGFEQCTCVRGGSGTAEDPYRITNWRIDLTPYRHQIEVNRTEETTQDAEPHTLVGVEFRNTTAHVLVEDVIVVDDGPQDDRDRAEEETIGFKAMNASNIHYRGVEADGTWAAYSHHKPVTDVTYEDARFETRFMQESDAQGTVHYLVHQLADLGPEAFQERWEELASGYFPDAGEHDNIAFRNVTAGIGLRAAADDSFSLGDWTLAANDLTVENLEIYQAGSEPINGEIWFRSDATLEGIEVEGNLGWICLSPCGDVAIEDVQVNGSTAFRTSVFGPGQAELTEVRNVTATGALSVDGYYGFEDVEIGDTFTFIPRDFGRLDEDKTAPDAFRIQDLTAEGYSLLRVDVPLQAQDVALASGVELTTVREGGEVAATFANVTAAGMPVVSLEAGDPHRVERPVAAAVVHPGAVVDELTVVGQTDETVPWLGPPFMTTEAHGVFVPGTDVTLRNLTIDAMGVHALPLLGGVQAEDVTIVAQDRRDQDDRFSGADYLAAGVDVIEGANRVDELSIEGVPSATVGVQARNPAHLTEGETWRIEDVGAGIVRFCFRGTDICRHIDVADVRIDSTYVGLWDVAPAFGIEAPHMPSEGPVEMQDADVSAPFPASIAFEASLQDVNLDRTDEEGYHFVLSQWSDVQVDGAWFDTGIPQAFCHECPFTDPLDDHVSLTNLQMAPFNEAPQLGFQTPADPLAPGEHTFEATVSDDWDTASTPTWQLDGQARQADALEVSLDHGVHPITVTVDDHRDGQAEASDDALVKAADRPLAYIHPVDPPARNTTVEVTGEGFGDVDELAWDVGADGTVDATGPSVSVSVDQREIPVSLTAIATDGDQHEHTRLVVAQDAPPAPEIALRDQAPEGFTLTAEAVGEDDWGIEEREWELLPFDVTEQGSTFTFTPDRPGPLPIRLSATDAAGQTASTFQTLQVRQSHLDLDVNINPVSPTTRDTVVFSTQDGEDWRWDVGDDGSIESYGPELRWRFHTPGHYTVTLSAIVEGERMERTVTVTVENVPPDAGIQVEPGPSGAVELTGFASDEGWTNMTWDVDGDDVPEFTGPSATWVPDPGTHIVTLTVMDDDGDRTEVSRILSIPAVLPGLTLDAETNVATVPFETPVKVHLPVPVRADTWRADLDADGEFERSGEIPMPSSFTANITENGTSVVSVELLNDGVPIAHGSSLMVGLDPGDTPPGVEVTPEGLGPGFIEGEPLTVKVEATDHDGLGPAQACTTECRNLTLEGLGDTDRVRLPTPEAGTPLTVQVNDTHNATSLESIELGAQPAEAPIVDVPAVTAPAHEPFRVPVDAQDPDERPLDISWKLDDDARNGTGEPGPFRLASGTYDVNATVQDPSGTAASDRGTAIVDEVHEAQLALADKDPRYGDELVFFAAVDDSHGPAHDVQGTLTLTWHPIADGPGVPIGTYEVDQARQVVETGVQHRPGTIVAHLDVEAGPSPNDPVPSRDAVSVELVLAEGPTQTSATGIHVPDTPEPAVSPAEPTVERTDTSAPALEVEEASPTSIAQRLLAAE